MAITEEHAFIEPLNPIWYQPYAQKVDMLRLDMLHPVISGNKWFKLKHNLRFAIEKGYDTILTFGGAYSNHLVATAAAAKEYGLKSIGIVRGIYARDEYTATLRDCAVGGMKLVFVSREDYNKKEDALWLENLSKQYDDPYIIPEGGANERGREGAEEIADFVLSQYTHICVSVGTGTTLAGIRNALPIKQIVLGFAPMNDGKYLEKEIAPHIKGNKSFVVFDRWSFGGFGKWNDKLLAFMNNFYQLNQIPLDFVYTAKMMYGVEQLLKENYFSHMGKVLCIHTGGLQGNSSINDLLEY
jgi:1-aminocyclopropane-1-carboxylate deaminase